MKLAAAVAIGVATLLLTACNPHEITAGDLASHEGISSTAAQTDIHEFLNTFKLAPQHLTELPVGPRLATVDEAITRIGDNYGNDAADVATQSLCNLVGNTLNNDKLPTRNEVIIEVVATSLGTQVEAADVIPQLDQLMEISDPTAGGSGLSMGERFHFFLVQRQICSK